MLVYTACRVQTFELNIHSKMPRQAIYYYLLLFILAIF